PAGELRFREEAARGRAAGTRGFGDAFLGALFSAASRLARGGARRPVAGRLLIQARSAPIASTSRFETTESGAPSVTSTFAFAYLSRCFSSSHSLPFGERPRIFTNAHSPNI